MGRPFIIYPEDDACGQGDSPSTSSYRNNDSWFEEASKVLEQLEVGVGNPAVSAILTYLLSQRKPAFIPICEPSPSSGLSLVDSRIGGVPHLLPSESWPSHHGTRLQHLLQLRVCDLPAAVQQALGYSRGLLQVFVSEQLHEYEMSDSEKAPGHPVPESKWYLVRVLLEEQLEGPRGAAIPSTSIATASTLAGPSARPSGADPAGPRHLGGPGATGSTASRQAPPGVEVLPEQAVVGFSLVDDWPEVEDLLAGLPGGLDPELVEDVVAALQDADLYDTVLGDKLLGWPSWCRGPDWGASDRGERFEQVLQIGGSVVPFTAGGGGTLQLQRHPAQRDQWAASWACC